MAMAGFHLSRNKMLFFGASLFITLAVFVHLTPYFPLLFSINNTVSNLNNKINSNNNNDVPQSCISHLHNVRFDLKSNTFLVNFSDGVEKIGSWDWVDTDNVNACGFQQLGRLDSSDLLNGSWVVVAGDSQSRLLSVSLLGLILGEKRMGIVRGDLFKRHSDYHIEIEEIGMRFDFVWAPYVENITSLVSGFGENRSYPNVFIMGAGLWHMLHVADSKDYGYLLRKLRRAMVSLGSPHVFWLGMPTLINSMLNTEEKRDKMSDIARERYNEELYASKLLRGYGGPLLMIDVETLSRRCGRKCTVDGMHYDDIVYEAVVHILLNALLIESHQKLS